MPIRMTADEFEASQREENLFIPEEDITRTLADGRVELVAAKGAAIPLAEARKRGLIKDQVQAGPQETKEGEPEQPPAPTPKGKKPAEQQ